MYCTISEIPRDSIVSLIIFLMGAPAIVYQFASTDVREILMNNSFKRLWIVFSLAALGAIVVIGVYSWQYYSEKLPCLWWDSTLIVLAILSIFAIAIIISITNKKQLVDSIAKKISRSTHHQERVSKKALDELSLLGKSSKSGEEKSWCISGLDLIVSKLLSQEENYYGLQFENIIRELIEILLDGTFSSSPDNFDQAINLLRKIISQHKQQTGSGNINWSDADLGHAIIAIGVFGVKALEFPVAGITTHCLNILTEICDGPNPNPKSSQAVREIGSSALIQDISSIAMQALNILSFMSEDVLVMMKNREIDINVLKALREVVFDYIGLLAVFWCNGKATQSIAIQHLDEFNASYSLEIKDFYEMAIQHHKKTNRFALTNKVINMCDQYEFPV